MQEEDVGVLEQWTILLSGQHGPMVQADDGLVYRLPLVVEGAELAPLRQVTNQKD